MSKDFLKNLKTIKNDFKEFSSFYIYIYIRIYNEINSKLKDFLLILWDFYDLNKEIFFEIKSENQTFFFVNALKNT